jgi:anti-anti-sigma factor
MTDDAARGADGDPAATDHRARFRAEAGTRFVVHVEGDVDADNGSELQALLDRGFDSSPEVVIVDLAALTFIDSVGLSVLVTAHNRGQASGVGFEVHNLPADRRRVFEITRLVDVLDLR